MVFAYLLAADVDFGGSPSGYFWKNASFDSTVALPFIDVNGFMLKSAVM